MTKLPVIEDTKVGIPTSVYKYFDKAGILIYVGITSGGILRNRQHNDSKSWWKYVVRQEIEHFKSRGLAHEREVQLIELYRPPFNKQHNKDYTAINSYYLAMVESDCAQELDPDLAARLAKNRAIALTLRSVDHKRRELEFYTPYGDVAVAEALWWDNVKVSPINDQNNDHMGHICGVRNLGAYAVVTVRLRQESFLNAQIKSAIGYLKNAVVFKTTRITFKRIECVIDPSVKKLKTAA